jgi:hypothetical protein
MRNLVLVVLLLGTWPVVGCRHRLPVGPGDAGAEAGLDGAIQIPDGPLADLGTPEICLKNQVPFTTHKDPRGNYTMVTTTGVTLQNLTVAGAKAKDSAAAVDGTGVAALVVTRATSHADPSVALAEIQQRFIGDLTTGKIGTATVRASGTSMKNAEGDPEIKEAIWDLAVNPAIPPGKLRDQLVASALLRPVSQITGFPTTSAAAANKIVVRLTLSLRKGQVVLGGAVASTSDYDDKTSSLSFDVDDLSNGTALARAGKQTVFECDIRRISGKPVADIIWVVDESGSMNDNRLDIVNNAKTFFDKVLAAGLDFRMGVAGMKRPDDSILPPVELGRFCSQATENTADEGGTDRFLLPSEKDEFKACVKNPPYFEGGSEYGLSNGYFAVKRHLPRAANRSDRIRTGAHLAIIFVTDETAQELKGGGELLGVPGFLGFNDYRKENCSLDEAKQKQLDGFIKPLRDLFSATSQVGALTKVHVIGGTCNNSCNAEIAYGYKELAVASGGQLGDVCQSDLNATLNVIINSITASASPRVLKYAPVSSTLAVSVNGLRLDRSRTKGYMYNAANNSLTFINVKVAKGHRVTAAYRRFPK